MRTVYLFIMFLITSVSAAATAVTDTVYHEKYRPQYHFSPYEGWIGDPCGFIHYQGKYHMYWWGKTESSDLVHYTQVVPVPGQRGNCMKGADRNIGYFTGSTVIDKHNTAGFGKNAYVAVYTAFNNDTKNQSQAISSSTDGNIYHYYENNPVLDIGSTEFRDPTVFFYEPDNRWVMVVAKALEKKISIYSSPDLKEWEWMSDFGPYGDQEKAWECPDLFQLPVDGNRNDMKWVMVISVNWDQVQYFVGDFNGREFVPDQEEYPLYVDKGLDYYAARTFRDYDGSLKTTTAMGWIATWEYARQVPSRYGQGFWSIPRNLELRSFPEGIRLVQSPAEQLEILRGEETSYDWEIPAGIHLLPEFTPERNVYELDITFSLNAANRFGLHLCTGSGRKVTVSYDTDSHTLQIDRTAVTDYGSMPGFDRICHAKVNPVGDKLRLHFYVDKSSIELFANDGKDVFTLLTYPSETQTGIEVFALRPGIGMEFSGWELESIWD